MLVASTKQVEFAGPCFQQTSRAGEKVGVFFMIFLRESTQRPTGCVVTLRGWVPSSLAGGLELNPSFPLLYVYQQSSEMLYICVVHSNPICTSLYTYIHVRMLCVEKKSVFV